MESARMHPSDIPLHPLALTGRCGAAAALCHAVLRAGELQRVAIALCLGQPANVYLIDEPSAYLDSEQRIMAAKVIKR